MYIHRIAGQSNASQGTAGNTHPSSQEKEFWKATDLPERICFADLRDSKTSSANRSPKVNIIFTWISLLKQLPDGFVFTSSLRSTNISKLLLQVTVGLWKEKNPLLQHYKHQKYYQTLSYEKTAIKEDKCWPIFSKQQETCLERKILTCLNEENQDKANSYFLLPEKQNHPVLQTGLY